MGATTQPRGGDARMVGGSDFPYQVGQSYLMTSRPFPQGGSPYSPSPPDPKRRRFRLSTLAVAIPRRPLDLVSP